MNIDHETSLSPMGSLTRRAALSRLGLGVGGLALGDLLAREGLLASQADGDDAPGIGPGGILDGLHHRPRARRVIYLFQSGGPSQLETFDYKPVLNEMNGKDLPDSVRQGQRLTGMSANQARLPLAGSIFPFAQHGQSGSWVSDRLPHTAKIVDELCIVRSCYTEAINHDPAITFLQTGSQLSGRPSFGSWLSYGLGSGNVDLPTFCVLISQNRSGQPLYSRLWGSGFLPSKYQGVKFLGGETPVYALANPAGTARGDRRLLLDHLSELNRELYAEVADPEIETRISQYELAYRMQDSVPEALDTRDEPERTWDLYGPESKKPGTYAANCLLARRLCERGVRFIQLYHQGWDQHGGLPGGLSRQCKDTDQASAALVLDLKQRGLLDDTLIIWGGEFGRTNYSQGKLTAKNYGRDHHPRCFTMWMAGGGVRAGTVFGETDEFGYNIASDPIHVHDLHATMLHLLGIDHERLTYRYQGRRYRLTDVHGKVFRQLLA